MKKAILIITLIGAISLNSKAQNNHPSTKEDTITLRMPQSKLIQLYGLIDFYNNNIATSRARSVDVEDSKESIKAVAPYLKPLETDTTKKVQVIILPKKAIVRN